MKLFNDKEIDWTAYQQGFDAYIEYDKTGVSVFNPYPKESDQWYSWNRGWNAA